MSLIQAHHKSVTIGLLSAHPNKFCCVKKIFCFSLDHVSDGVWISVPERKVACCNEAKVEER